MRYFTKNRNGKIGGGEKFPRLDYTIDGEISTIVGNLISQLRSNPEQTAGRLRYNKIGVSKAGEDKYQSVSTLIFKDCDGNELTRFEAYNDEVSFSGYQNLENSVIIQNVYSVESSSHWNVSEKDTYLYATLDSNLSNPKNLSFKVDVTKIPWADGLHFGSRGYDGFVSVENGPLIEFSFFQDGKDKLVIPWLSLRETPISQ